MDTEFKEHPDLKEELIKYLATHKTVDDFSLHHTNLRHINLTHHDSPSGYKILNCDFYRADLRDKHLFDLRLAGSSLMKADLPGANLHCANLENCNFLSTKFHDAMLENVNWDRELVQEKHARETERSGDKKEMINMLNQAEEISRNLRMENERQGIFDVASFFFRKEMTMRRFKLPR